jgi:hypothetical protein
MSEQKPPNVLLDEIEKRRNEAKREGLDFETFAINLAKTARDVPKLYKIAKMYVAELTFHGRKKKLADITVILNGEETDADKTLGEHGAE